MCVSTGHIGGHGDIEGEHEGHGGDIGRTRGHGGDIRRTRGHGGVTENMWDIGDGGAGTILSCDQKPILLRLQRIYIGYSCRILNFGNNFPLVICSS